MSYQVIITDPAEAELVQAFEWWATHRSPEQAACWYNGILAALQSLAESPERCPLIPEASKFAITLRELYFGLGFVVLSSLGAHPPAPEGGKDVRSRTNTQQPPQSPPAGFVVQNPEGLLLKNKNKQILPTNSSQEPKKYFNN